MSSGLVHTNPLHTQSLKVRTGSASPNSSSRSTLRWHDARPWMTNAALIFFGSALALLSRHLVSEYDHFTIGFSGVSSWSAVLYLASVFLVLTQPVDHFTFPIILTIAIACRLTPLFGEPYLSSDIYRYVWDGVVQHAHISPYRYAPGDPALAFLHAPNQDIFDNINRRDYAHTIYPPVAQALFYCITFFSPTLQAMKLAMVLFEGLTLYALVKILRIIRPAVRHPEAQSLLFAWCPLMIWEVSGSGHVDSVAIAFGRWRGGNAQLWKAFNPGSETSSPLNDFRQPTTAHRWSRFLPAT